METNPNLNITQSLLEEPDPLPDSEENPLLSTSPVSNPKSELSKVNKVLIISIVVVFLTLLLSYIILSCFPKPYSKLFIGLEKPMYDIRKYKAFELSNQMKILLISDPDVELGGVSIDVGVGSWNEPDELPGLAHFLEHMLFMGSKKYPNVSEFNDFVSQNGGNYNAMTNIENTNFFYTLSSDALEKSMDIFSRFFIDPLLSEETVGKEINAVNSEYTNDLTDPNWKLDIALELITNKGNPASRFSIGNLQTLRDTPSQNHINTYQELKKFHAKYYSSNIMSAVVISNEPLEKIEKMVKDKFSDIPNKQIDRKAINTFKEKAFDARNKGLFFQYKSPKDENTLQIAFVIDSKLDDFTRKPLAYIGNFIDNENPKGFSVFLKDSGYVTGVETMIQSQNLDFSLFVISLSLTEKGYKEIESLLKYVFGYLRKIDKEGISLERFEEFKKIYAFDFLYKEKPNELMEEIRDLSYSLNTYPIDNVLNNQYFIGSYDENLYKTVISSFIPNNSIIILGSKEFIYKNESNNNENTSHSFFHQIQLNNYSEIYQFAYNYNKIPENLITKLSTNYTTSTFEKIKLPNKNRYLPESFNSLNDSAFQAIYSKKGNFRIENSKKTSLNSNPTPSILLNNEKYTIWHKTDQTFKLPIYVIHLSIDSPLTHKSARNTLYMLILIQYLSQETSKILYDAIYLGYRIEFQNNGRGLEIMVKGYSDKTDLALLEIIKLIKNVTLDSKTFDFLTRIVLRDLKNDYTEAVHKHGKEILKKILRKFYYLPNELEKEYDKIDLEDFNQFMNEFISKLFVEVLVYGNVDRDVTKKMAKKLIRLLDFKGIEKDDLMKEEILNIKDHIYYYRDFNENEIDQNNLLMNYYQYGPYEFHTSFLLNIINEKLSNDAFNYLRGELQLGYIAASFKINLYGIVGLVILVQGSVADPIIMDEKTEQFLETFSESIFKMSDEEFESITQSLIKILQEGEKEIEEKASLVWEEIRSHFYEFEKRKNAIKYLKSLKKEELIHFYRSFISQNIGKLSVQLFSQAKDNKILDDKIVDQNKTYIHVNGSSSVILSNFEIFQGIQRYKYQSGNEELEIFTNNTNINKE